MARLADVGSGTHRGCSAFQLENGWVSSHESCCKGLLGSRIPVVEVQELGFRETSFEGGVDGGCRPMLPDLEVAPGPEAGVGPPWEAAWHSEGAPGRVHLVVRKGRTPRVLRGGFTRSFRPGRCRMNREFSPVRVSSGGAGSTASAVSMVP
jgi:hypothetical protein